MKRYKTPLYLNFFVTNRCQLNCLHCFYHRHLNRSVDELKIDDIKKIARSLEQPLKLLLLTGGEPFLKSNLPDICSVFSNLNKTKHININTNGYNPGLISRSLLKIKKGIRSDTGLSVHISLDGFEKTNDRVRGNGSFQNALDTIKRLKTIKDIDLTVITTISKLNLKEIEEFASFIRQLDLKHKFQFIRDSHRYTFNLNAQLLNDFDLISNELLLSNREISKANLLVSKLERDYNQNLKREIFIKNIKNKKRNIDCLAGLVYAVLYSDGKVSFCEPIRPFADIKDFDYSFRNFWESELVRYTKKNTKKCFCVDPCSSLVSIYEHKN